MDLYNQLSPVNAMDIAARTASANGNIIDMLGFSELVIAILTGTTTTADATNRFDFKLQHGSASDGSDMADVALTDVQGAPSINLATQDNVLLGKIAYKPLEQSAKRYVRLVATEVGTADATFGAIGFRGGARKTPVS